MATEIEWSDNNWAPRELTSFQNKLFFFAQTSENDGGLWVSDGTDAGTFLVRRFYRDFTNLTVHQGFLYFYAQDDEEAERALWRSDGTAVGTVKAVELPPDFDRGQSLFTTSAGPLLFLWNLSVEGQRGFWVSDGTTAGTRRVSPVELIPFSFSVPLVLDGIVYFSGRQGNVQGLWRSDGTSAGTFLILDTVSFASLGPFTTVGGLIFFNNSGALWQSDGTTAGTLKIRDQAGSPSAVGPRVFFPAYDPAIGYELWAIDTRED
jgi:ELWxxDGT repeat protein